MEDIKKLVEALEITKQSIESLAAAYQAAVDELDAAGDRAAELGRVTYYANFIALEKILEALEELPSAD